MENSNYEYEHPLTEKDKETVQQDFSNLQVEVNKVIENSKYYAPSIEEFHVGFEFEIWYSCAYTPELWEKETLELYKGEDLNMLADGCHQLRVKYLDQSDIESLGWKETCTDYIYTIATNKVQLRYNDTVALLEMYKENNTFTIMYSCECIFKGTIKNKSELKKLMRWLNIN